jgi:hypothetical protein
MSLGKPILFYSKQCPYSQRLWTMLQNDNRLNDFIKISTDDNVAKIPPYIREVPTIYVNPQQIYTGMNIHNYLSSLPPQVSAVSFGSMPPVTQSHASSSQQSQSTTYQPMSSSGPKPSGNINFAKMDANIPSRLDTRPRVDTGTSGHSGIDDFIPSEMSGAWSDSYSFLQDNPAPMLMNFDYINDTSVTEKDKQRLSASASASSAKQNVVLSETERRYAEMQKARQMPISTQRLVR